MKSFYGAVFVFLFAIAAVAGIVDDKILIKEIYSSPPPERNGNFNLLKDGAPSTELKKNVQWNVDSKTSLANIQIDLVFETPSIVEKVEVQSMQRISWGIFSPESVTVMGSADGKKWEKFGTVAWHSKEERAEHCYTLDVPAKFNQKINFMRLLLGCGGSARNFSAVCISEVGVCGLKTDEAVENKIPKLVRNYIANGSFESNSIPAIPDFWSAMCYWPDYDYVNMVNIFSDAAEPFSGKYSLCVDGSAFKENFKANDIKIGQSFLIGGGSRYTVSFYAKALKPGAALKVISGKSSKIFKLSDKWERYEFVTTYSDGKKQFLFFQLLPVKELDRRAGVYEASQKIWLDDVQIEEGASAGPYTSNYLDMASVKQQEAETAKPVVKVPEIKEIINPDAVFDEPFYKEVGPTINKLHYIGSSETAAKGMDAYIFRDKENMYISVNLPIPDGTASSAAVSEHDGAVYTDDSVEIFLMPDSGKKEYFHFAVNSIGTVFDCRYQFGEKSVSDIGWTAPFKYSVVRDKKFWTLDIAVPQSWLGMYLGDGECRFNICRKNTSWAFVQSGFHEPANFGILEGLESFKQARQLCVGPAMASCELKNQKNVLEIPLFAQSGKSLNFTIKAVIVPVTAGKDKIIKEEKITLAERGTVRFMLPGNLRDLHYVNITAFDSEGNAVGQSCQDIIFKAPVALQMNKFFIKGEPIVIKPILTFENPAAFSASIKIRDINGKLIHSRDIPVLPGGPEPFSSEGLVEGRYSVEFCVTDKSGTTLYSSYAKTYVSPPVSSWSRIDSETMALVVNGKAIFPFGPYYQPMDGLAYLKENCYNICFYRPSLPFNEKRCLQFLDEAEKNGISVFIDLTTIMRVVKEEEEFFKTLEKIVNLVRLHPAYAGIHQCDEPNNKPEGLKTQENLRKTYAFLEAIDPAHISFFVVGGVLTYRYAFDAEDVICYDRYATVTGPETRNLRENTSALHAALATASYYNKPVWRALEGNEGAFPNWVRNPSAKEWNVLVFSTLAAGGNGIFLWSGESSFLKLRDIWSDTNKKFSELVPYFLNGKKSFSIKLVAPENLLWRAVDCEGQTILLIVNLDYQKVPCRFSIGRKISSVYDLMRNRAIFYKGDPELTYELAPYEVIALSIK